jgi:EAL domain-containing protein (putative c-di-GMP-specific phosphodiesterase class I)
MGLGIIAEGVETRDQEVQLLEMGCRHGQGYLFGKALPAAQFACLFQPAGGLKFLAG